MVLVENIVVKGKYFFPIGFDKIHDLKKTIQEYLAKKMYEPEDIRTIFFQDRFLTANFRLSFGRFDVPWNLKLKRDLGLITDEQIQTKLYFEKLASKRLDVPFKIKFMLYPQKMNNVDGIIIDVTSIPAAYYHISQMNRNLYLDKSDYSRIKYENTEFIKEIMAAIHARTISEPALMSAYIKNELSEKLSAYNFTKIAKLLGDGKQKLELGENAVPDLLGVIENFLVELLTRIGVQPAGLHEPEKNITKLKTAGFLNYMTEGTLQSALFHSVYRKLKNVDHKKESMDYFDVMLYFGITESIIDYLLDRVVKYKIKSAAVSQAKEVDKDAAL